MSNRSPTELSGAQGCAAKLTLTTRKHLLTEREFSNLRSVFERGGEDEPRMDAVTSMTLIIFTTVVTYGKYQLNHISLFVVGFWLMAVPSLIPFLPHQGRTSSSNPRVRSTFKLVGLLVSHV